MSRGRQAVDMVGQVFGRLTVISRAGSNAFHQAMWLCRCVCGAMTVVPGNSLRFGKTRSCGCTLGAYPSRAVAARRKVYGRKRPPRGLMIDIPGEDDDIL